MATILTGSIVSEIRGSVGSETYSRNAFGAYVKARVAPANPNTVPQQDARARLAAAVTAWQGLSEVDRLSYISEAAGRSNINRLGVKIRVTGYQLFITQHIMYDRAGVSFVAGVSAPIRPSINQSSSIVTSASAMNTTVEYSGSITGSHLFIFATPPRSSSQVSFNPSKARFLREFSSFDGSTTRGFLFAWQTIYGPSADHIGDITTVGIRTASLLDGLYSEPMFFNSLIAA